MVTYLDPAKHITTAVIEAICYRYQKKDSLVYRTLFAWATAREQEAAGQGSFVDQQRYTILLQKNAESVG